jgi:hypothetical protein
MSTIHAIFDGKRELFDGLAIADKPDIDWAKHPVLHLDLNTEKYDSKERLEGQLNNFLAQQEAIYGKNENEVSFGLRFQGVIQRAYDKTGKGVVILVDEYDKPMLDVLDSYVMTTLNGQPISVEEDNRQELKAFYSCFKAADDDLRFVLLTGVTKFSQVSVFSGFNQPSDITLDSRYEALCGITEEELYS